MCAGSSAIDLQRFRDNMGVLGLRIAEPFTNRIFASFDIDNDGLVVDVLIKINFNDFVEYSDILRNGSLRSKAFLSFRMIDVAKAGFITRHNFMMFLKDFLWAWSAITNVPICKPLFG